MSASNPEDGRRVLAYECRECGTLYDERPTCEACPSCGYDGEVRRT